MADIVTCGSCGKNNRVPASASGTPRCASCHTDLPWLVEAGEKDFAAVTRSRVPVLVDLWAPWCGPCRMVAPAWLSARAYILHTLLDELISW